MVTTSKKSVLEISLFELLRPKPVEAGCATKKVANGTFRGFRGAMALATPADNPRHGSPRVLEYLYSHQSMTPSHGRQMVVRSKIHKFSTATEQPTNSNFGFHGPPTAAGALQRPLDDAVAVQKGDHLETRPSASAEPRGL